MVCYIVPLIGAMVHFGARRRVEGWRTSVHHLWLNLLLAGGAVFGVVDHLWNGELFLFGGNLAWDLLLGVTITVTMVAVWAVIVLASGAPAEDPATSS